MDNPSAQLVVPWIELAIVTILALLGTYIAWHQLQTNRQRLETNRERMESERRDRALQRQRDLYDRRWRVYEGVLTYLSEMMGDLKPETMRRALTELHRVRTEAHFLFGSDVRTYLEELTDHGAALCRWTSEYRDYTQTSPPGYDHKKVVSGHNEELMWFSKQLGAVPQPFEKYLRLSDE